jgi:hypothetical protein
MARITTIAVTITIRTSEYPDVCRRQRARLRESACFLTRAADQSARQGPKKPAPASARLRRNRNLLRLADNHQHHRRSHRSAATNSRRVRSRACVFLPGLIARTLADLAVRQLYRQPRRPASILEKTVSDRRTLGDLSQSAILRPTLRRKLLIQNGEMSEWLKEHAWKAKRASDTEPLRSALTHKRSALILPNVHSVCVRKPRYSLRS